MSETDSFINEVNDEVRSDRLYMLMRRYGWIAVLVVLLLVGGAAYSEYRKSAVRADSEAVGNAMMNALELDDEAERIAGLIDVQNADGSANFVASLLAASEQQRAGDIEAAVASLALVSNDTDVDPLYRDLASLKSLMLQSASLDADARRAALEPLAQAGAPYRLLAIEQLALVDVDAGDAEGAIARLRALAEDALVTNGSKDRAISLIVALGGDVDDLIGQTEGQ